MVDKKNSIATDSFILMFVKCITMAVGIIQAMVLARTLSKDYYGTYSEALLVISFFSPLLSLGLDNAINYFFNKTDILDEKKGYVNTIVFLSSIVGIIGGLVLIICKNGISSYYKNTAILPLVIYIAFRPCLANLIALYQPLYISSGYAKVIAIRNLILSICQVFIITLSSIYTKDLTILFSLLLVLDLVQLIFFAQYYGHHNFYVNPFKFVRKYCKPVLIYAFPMMLSNAIGTLSINMDYLVISNLMSVESYALYSNMGKELPFSFIAASFTAVVAPQIVKFLNNNKMLDFKNLWSDYLEIGYTMTWPLCCGAIIMAPQIITILYSTKYLSDTGLIVFRIYTIVAMCRFTWYGLVPTAKGETKIVLYYSILGLVINAALNYLLFVLMGMIGPALSTLISLSISSILYLKRSMKLTDSSFSEILRLKKIAILIFVIIVASIADIILIRIINTYVNNVIIQFILGYCFFVGFVYLIKLKDIKRLIHRLNNTY